MVAIYSEHLEDFVPFICVSVVSILRAALKINNLLRQIFYL